VKQLLILSGKGGTGKTTIASAMIALSQTHIYADCDVDAPNLHLTASNIGMAKRKPFIGMDKSIIDQSICSHCGQCMEVCRFDAIKLIDGDYHVDEFACEGCGVCQTVCPTKAITMSESVAGELMLFDEVDYFSTAKLKMGSGTSGKLVSEVKQGLKEYKGSDDLTIIDGSPGIGCPVIASISGVTMVLVVAEPSLSGFSDMERILATAKHFATKVAVCVNKADQLPAITDKIKEFCQKEDVPFVGVIPYDSDVPKLLNEGKNIVASPCKARDYVTEIYHKTMALV